MDQHVFYHFLQRKHGVIMHIRLPRTSTNESCTSEQFAILRPLPPSRWHLVHFWRPGLGPFPYAWQRHTAVAAATYITIYGIIITGLLPYMFKWVAAAAAARRCRAYGNGPLTWGLGRGQGGGGDTKQEGRVGGK